LTIKLDNFLEFVGNELNDAVFPWAVRKEKKLIAKSLIMIKGKKEKSDEDPIKDIPLEEVDEHTADTIPSSDISDDVKKEIMDYFIGIKIDDDESIVIEPDPEEGSTDSVKPGMTLKDYLNSKIELYGMSNNEFSLDVGYDQNVKSILDARNAQLQEAENKNLEDKRSKTRDVKRDREVADRTAEREQNAADLEQYEKPLIDALSKGAKEVNKGYKVDTLFLGASNEMGFVAAATQALTHKKKIGASDEKKKGGDDGNKN
jgi:hypothetical protein